MVVDRNYILDFLKSYALSKTVLKDIEESCATLWASATKTTTAVTGMPRGGGSDRHSMMANIIDKKMDYDSWIRITRDRQENVATFIDASPIPLIQKSILFYRYCCLYKWSKVKEKIDGMYESTLLRQLYREHNKAIEALVEWVNEDKKAKEIIELWGKIDDKRTSA